MNGNKSVRYTLDFKVVPSLYHEKPEEFAQVFPTILGKLLPGMYDNAFNTSRRFWQKRADYTPKDFPYTEKSYPDGIKVGYVSVPPATDGSAIYCIGYALASYRDSHSFYTIERSLLKTTAIGTVTARGDHINMGPAGNNIPENIDLIHQLFLSSQPGIASGVSFTSQPSSNQFDSSESSSVWVSASDDSNYGNFPSDIVSPPAPSTFDRHSSNSGKMELDIGSVSADSNYDPSNTDVSFGSETKPVKKVTPPTSIGKKNDPTSKTASKATPPKPTIPAGSSKTDRKSMTTTPTPKSTDDAASAELIKQINEFTRYHFPVSKSAADQEANAKKVMKKIREFRERGATRDNLYELESQLAALMPNYIASHLREVFLFLEQDVTCFCIAMERKLDSFDYQGAKKLGDSIVDYLMINRKKLIGNRHFFANELERKLYAVANKKKLASPSPQTGYVRLLVDYARALQRIRNQDNSGKDFCCREAREYLDLALDLNPVNAAAWLYMGIGSTNPDEKLACYTNALYYCYQSKGYCGLTEIYEELGMYYLERGRVDIATAINDLIRVLGKYTIKLSLTLKRHPEPEKRPFLDVLEENKIQIGFSEPVKTAAKELSNPAVNPEDPTLIRKIQRDIQSVQAVLR